MRFFLLGTTRATHPDGTAVALGGARLRALLAVLALRPGRTVPLGVLIDGIWDGDPPADAPAAVQALVGRLRKALGRSAVASAEGGGYRLRAAADDVDLHRFDRLTGEGVRELERDDPAKAAELLDEALGLWRGPVLADLPGREAHAPRWESRRLDARRTRLAAGLALGRPDEILSELASLCERHPMDEPLQALRLRALRATGRPAEALAAYEAFRRRLAELLGTGPGPELRALHAALLAADAAPAPRPSRESGAPAPGNLRARLTSFVGREADIETVLAELGRARLVTLLGPGGAGKTRLSQEAAERAAPDAPDGVWVAELASVTDPDDVAEAVLAAIGARQTVLRGAGAEELRAAEGHADDALTRLTEHCARRRMLLLLDNCEHVVGTAAVLAQRLLESCPGVTVLATSREPLGIPGEVVRPVEPLPDPVALRLLGERGAAVRPGFAVADDPAACAEICRRLDGLPLAIELAAARLRMLTPRQIADRLDDRFGLLTGGSRTALARQQTLRAVVDWSWELLGEAERAVLRRLSVFSGGCDLAAAEAVCATSPEDSGEVSDSLGTLIDKSLVVAVPDGPRGMRYRLLETVAEYAAARLDEAAERPGAERRHLVHYRELARRTDPLLRGSRQLGAIALFRSEQENLRTALRRAVALRDEQEALHLVLCLFWYWQLIDLRTEIRHWAGAASALGPDPFRAPVAPAPPVLERFTDAPPPMGPELLAEARRGVTLIRMVYTSHDIGTWFTEPNMNRLRVVNDVYRPGLPQTCRSPGTLWFFAMLTAGDRDTLRAMLDESVRACREYGYEWELASALQVRASVLANHGSWTGQATRDANEALEMFRRIGDSWGTAEAYSARGEARERRGEYAPAAEDFGAAIEYAELLGAKVQVAVLRARLGGLLLHLGEYERGEALLREVLAEDGMGPAHEATAIAQVALSLWMGRVGRRDEARVHVGLLLEQFRSATLAIFRGMMVGTLAWLDLGDGDFPRALERAKEALVQAGDPLCLMLAPQLVSAHLVTIAGALAGLRPERAADAARVLAVADAQEPPDYFPPPHERENRSAAEAAARSLLGDAAFGTAYAAGAGLTVEEAVALTAVPS